MINRTSIIKQPDKISFFNDVYKLQKKYQDSLISGKSNMNFITKPSKKKIRKTDRKHKMKGV